MIATNSINTETDRRNCTRTPVASPTSAAQARKISHKEQRELDAIPAQIQALEAEQRTIRRALADGSIYSRDAALAMSHAQREAAIDESLLALMERQEVLQS